MMHLTRVGFSLLVAFTLAGSTGMGSQHAGNVPSSYGTLTRVAQQTSNVCQTPAGVCLLPGSAPPGSPCWCAFASGPVQGHVR